MKIENYKLKIRCFFPANGREAVTSSEAQRKEAGAQDALSGARKIAGTIP
jgi:hypothetical protein